MKTLSNALQSAGKYALTDHARERIRQRLGILSDEAAIAWVSEAVRKASGTKKDGRKTHYITEAYEIVCEGVRVITIKPCDTANAYLPKFNDVITKEATKLTQKYRRELRKAEIAVAETQLNLLRARNPKTKAIISGKLTEACDWKAALEDEIKAIEIAAKKYGVEI